MSQVIVIDSSDEDAEPGTKETLPEKEEDEEVPKSETPCVESLFSTFCSHCKELVKDNEKGDKILKFLRKKHELSSSQFRSSRSYRKILQSCISKLSKDSKDVYVHIHNVISVLDKSDMKCSKRKSSDVQEEGIKKRRISLQTLPSKKVPNEQDTATDNKTAEIKSIEDCQPKSVPEVPSSSLILQEERCQRRTKKLESLLKKISNEITRLQSVELSLDEMDKEDTSYIQESKLKERFMVVYNELCKLNKSSSSTGRVIEKKIRVTASRFSEINLKVERFINNPRRDCDFPDFSNIFHLVKQANIKSQLHLSENEIENDSRRVFQEVGEKMQKRRQQDFGFEFGCRLLDEQKDSDPAVGDSALREKLAKNRSAARKKMDSVIDKFTAMQQSINDRDPNDPALQEDNGIKESDNESSDDAVEFIPSDCNLLSNFDNAESSNDDKVQFNSDNKPNGNISGLEENKPEFQSG